MMVTSLEQILLERYPKEMAEWDYWDYTIRCPLSMYERAALYVILKNKNGKRYDLELDLSVL